MVTYCFVNGCRNTSNNKSGITFHAFPSNPELRQKWLQVIGRPSWDPPSHVRVCSEHFRQSDQNEGVTVEIKEVEFELLPNSLTKASPLEICRICLATDIKMFGFQEGTLKTCMETFFRLNDNEQNVDGLPQYVCYECGAQLLKCYKLVEKSLRAQSTLQDIFAQNCEITKDLVKQRDRKLLNLQSPLAYPTAGAGSIYVCKYEGDDDDSDAGCHDLETKDDIEIQSPETFKEIEKVRTRKRKFQVSSKKSQSKREKKKKHEKHPIPVQNSKTQINEVIVKSDSHLYSDYPCVETTYSDAEDSSEDMKPIASNKTFGVAKKELLSDNESEKETKLSVSRNRPKSKKSSKCVIPKKSKTTATKRKVKKKPGENEEIIIEKLKTCFNIEDLSLQEQLDAWKNEIEQEAGPNWSLKCEICSKKFLRNSKMYKKHVARHNKVRGKYLCRVCAERFRNATRLNAHTMRVHCKKYECKKCPTKVFLNMFSAQRHFAHHSVEVHECGQCPFTTRLRSKVWEHRRAEHGRDHHCARCGHSFLNAKGLATHRGVAHSGQEESPVGEFRCEECDVAFNTEGAKRVHLLTYRLHKNKVTPDETLDAVCLLCAATFPTKAELRAHKKKKHPQTEYKYKHCSAPDATYPRKCDHCDEEMRTRREHYFHVKRMHGAEHYHPDVSYVCDKCGKGYANISQFRYHVASHLGAPSLPCSGCDKKFFSPPELYRHAVVHHAHHKRFACPDCGKAFRVKGNMLRHRRMHTGEMPYECKYCGKKCKYWETLDLHIKHVHHKIPWPARGRKFPKGKSDMEEAGD